MALWLAAFVSCAVMAGTTVAEESTPGFNTRIPESILTPDTVETKVGTLKFFDGIPDADAAKALFANLDLNRGLQTILNGMPASNFEAGRRGHIALGQEKANQAIIFDGLMDSSSLFLTGNAGTVYLTTFLDLERDGPTVVEIPAGTGPGRWRRRTPYLRLHLRFGPGAQSFRRPDRARGLPQPDDAPGQA